MPSAITKEMIRDAVLELYLDGKRSTTKTIAEYLKCSEAVVQKRIRESPGGMINGMVQEHTLGRLRYFLPERRYLAEIIKQLRKERCGQSSESTT